MIKADAKQEGPKKINYAAECKFKSPTYLLNRDHRIGNVSQHLISYHKIVEDVENGRLQSPLPKLISLDISPEHFDKSASLSREVFSLT